MVCCQKKKAGLGSSVSLAIKPQFLESVDPRLSEEDRKEVCPTNNKTMAHICALLSFYSRVDSLHCYSCCWCSQWHYMPSGAGRSAGASHRRAQAPKPLMRFTISRQCCWALRPGRASVPPGFRHTTPSLVYPFGRPPSWMTTTMKRRRTHPGGPTMSHVRMNSAAR